MEEWGLRMKKIAYILSILITISLISNESHAAFSIGPRTVGVNNGSSSLDSDLSTFAEIPFYWQESGFRHFLHLFADPGPSDDFSFYISIDQLTPGSQLIIEVESGVGSNTWINITTIELGVPKTTAQITVYDWIYYATAGQISLRIRWVGVSGDDLAIFEIWEEGDTPPGALELIVSPKRWLDSKAIEADHDEETKNFTLTNITGQDTYLLTTLSASPANFTISGCNDTYILANNICTFYVTFHPTEDGPYDGEVNVYYAVDANSIQNDIEVYVLSIPITRLAWVDYWDGSGGA